jgi:sterol desaturase/sphingolipid hydroxylase (fatty acid hydroxylase superfamily)
MTRELLPLIASSFMVVFFAIEFVYSRVKRDGRCEIKDSATNCAIGAGYLLFNGLWGVVTAGVFLAAYSITPLRIDMSSGWSWLALFVLHDLLFYWSHRASHTIGILWAAHTVHHSSHKLNLSTGMRNSWIGGIMDWPFIVPLALLGFDPLSIAIAQVMTTVWDFFAHTAYVPKLPWLNGFMNTPANHAVHHSAAHEDLNANFGAILIVWDRLFGTYRPAVPVKVYGMEELPQRPYNPVYLELNPFVQWTARLLRRKRANAA